MVLMALGIITLVAGVPFLAFYIGGKAREKYNEFENPYENSFKYIYKDDNP